MHHANLMVAIILLFENKLTLQLLEDCIPQTPYFRDLLLTKAPALIDPWICLDSCSSSGSHLTKIQELATPDKT